MIAHPLSTVQFDTALRTAAALAHERYPGEGPRIDRGLVLALNGAVTFEPNGTATVRSAKDDEVGYHVNGTCECYDAAHAAPEGRCKHKWAKAFAHKAGRFYAIATLPDGTELNGTATWSPRGYVFVDEAGMAPFYASLESLVLLGHVLTATAPLGEAWMHNLLRGGCTAA